MYPNPGRMVATGLALLLLLAPGATASADETGGEREASLPEGVPAAALRAEPTLPVPRGWPFPDAFPRTSGTGRLVAGSLQWTDFVYDDHGAIGTYRQFPVANLAPPSGTYRYRDADEANNGADIFRIGIGVDDDASYWRVDWNTLVRRDVPIAAWAFDTDAALATGASEWPANAGIRSPGADRFLLVSSAGAWLIDGVSGKRTNVEALGGSVAVDTAARSFVVRLPRPALEPSGTWRVRVAAGLATEDGTAFETIGADRGALPGQPNVYNVGFRSYDQERAQSRLNFWMDRAQAGVLSAGGNVHRFHVSVSWRDLKRDVTTAEAMPTGLTNRWYVSSIELGQGVVGGHDDPEDATRALEIRPDFLGRVQPYAVYVPAAYDGTRPVPLTWLLHSLELAHNQFGALSPRFLRIACEQRGSICATPLARGGDGWYLDEAEVDFWEVWRGVAETFLLDPDRTAIAGYSMGGYGTYRIGLTYPHLFAKAVVIAGPPLCGFRFIEHVEGYPDGGRCATDGDTAELVDNARWLPYGIVHGAGDELVPVTGVLEQAQRFEAAGNRFRFEMYPDTHNAPAAVDLISAGARLLGDRVRTESPGRIEYRWRPHLARADLGIGPAGLYWMGDLAARDASPGTLAEIVALTLARPDPVITPVQHTGPAVRDDGSPGVARQQTWRFRPAPPAEPRVELDLVNVAALTLDVPRAGIDAGDPGAVTVATDGPTALTLTGLEPGTSVSVGDAAAGTADAGGSITVSIAAGGHTIRF